MTNKDKIRLSKSLNILHYCIYIIHYKIHLFVNRINPFRLIHKLPFQKKKYKELGINIDEEINKSFYDRKNGLSLIFAGGISLIILFFFLVGFSSLLIKIFISEFRLNTIFITIIFISSFLLCYIIIFRKDRYLEYFEKYDTWIPRVKYQNLMLSIIFTIVSILIFLMSFIQLF